MKVNQETQHHSSPGSSASLSNAPFVRNVLLKALIFFGVLNLVFLWSNPLPSLGRISAYNSILPGRVRLPFGEDSERSYNISILQLEAMQNSHEISTGEKPVDEYRVLLVGDSSVWGFLLNPDETISAQINQLNLVTEDDRRIRAYNFGYPTMSVTKDLLFLKMGLKFRPDLILWFVTLESLPLKKQLTSPILQHNPGPVRELIDLEDVGIDPYDEAFIDLSSLEQTLVGRRRELADLIRLQFYGLMWAGTGIDHYIPDELERPSDDQSDDTTFQEYERGSLPEGEIAYDIIKAGFQEAGEIPLILINESIFIAQGENSEIRYNSFYPRWVYDQYRVKMLELVELEGWHYLDLWDEVPPGEFTDSAIHYSTAGVKRVVDRIRVILEEVSRGID
jgi:hypothetical protein